MIDPAFADLLARERKRLQQQIVELQRSFDDIVEASDSQALDDEHDPDGSTVAFERAQISALLAQAQRQLSYVGEADERLRNGSYGKCERCGEPIAIERLEAVPLTTVCVNC